MKPLKLGQLPRLEVVKMTISLSAQLKTDLELYAQVHAQSVGSPLADAAALVPHMLQLFIDSDPGFRTFRKKKTTVPGGPLSSP